MGASDTPKHHASFGGTLQKAWQHVRPKKRNVDLGPATVILVAAVYCGLYFTVGDVWLAGTEVFALAALWVTALAAAELASWLRLPRAPAMVISGLALAQIPGSATLHLPGPWVSSIRALALSIALVMGGLELDVGSIWRLKTKASAYCFVPLVAVVAIVTGVAMAMVHMPALLGITFGFIMNATSPGIIVAQMLLLTSNGYGITNDIGVIAMLASILDEVSNLTGWAIFASLAIPSGESSLAWTILKGPTEVVVGVAAGAVLGAVCGCTRIWNSALKASTVVLVSVLMLMAIMAEKRVEMMTGGAIGALVIGLVAPLMWEKGWPRGLSQGHRQHYAHALEHTTAMLWSWIFEPLLFGTIAYDVVFSQIEGAMIAKATAIIFITQSVRFLMAGGIMMALKFSWKEALFFAVTWMPKGTVQAALGSKPLNLARLHAEHLTNLDEMIEWGRLIKASAALSVAIFAAIGTMGIEKLAPILLTKEKTTIQQLEEELGAIEREGTQLMLQKDVEQQGAAPGLAATSAAAPTVDSDMQAHGQFDKPLNRKLQKQSTLERATLLVAQHHLQQQPLLGQQLPAESRPVGTVKPLDVPPEVLANPAGIKEYFAAVKDLVDMLLDNPQVLAQLPDAAVRETNHIMALHQSLCPPEPSNARQMQRVVNELYELRQLRQLMVQRPEKHRASSLPGSLPTWSSNTAGGTSRVKSMRSASSTTGVSSPRSRGSQDQWSP